MARPKQRIGIDRESRSTKRVKAACPNGRSEPDSPGTSNHEVIGDEPSIDTSGGHPDTWLEDALQAGHEEEVHKAALSADQTMPPSSPEEEDCVVLKSVAGSKTEYHGSTKVTVQGLDDGQVESGGRNGSNSAADARGFDCTTCGKKFFTTWDIREHPHLGVGICRSCRNFLFSSPYTKSAVDGYEEQCRWCGEGGQIVMCDDCDKAFCNACIVRNFGPKDLHAIVNSVHWSCYICKPELLCDHVNEFQKFKTSAPSADRFPATRRGAAGKSRITRDGSSNNSRRTGDGEGATIAELLAHEEERRRQNPGEWMKPRQGRPGRKPLGAPNGALPKQAGRARVRHPTGMNRQSTNPNATIADIVHKAATPSVAPVKTYIRPHQWLEKRQQAAARRKRAEEAAQADQRLKNVANPKNNEDDSSTQAKAGPSVPHIRLNEDNEVHPRHQREDTGKPHIMDENGMTQRTVKSEHIVPESDVAVGNEREVEKTIFYSEGIPSSGDLMQTGEDAFGTTAKNLFANFAGVSCLSGEDQMN